MATKYPDSDLPWPIIWAGVEVIAEAEQCRLKSYLCPAGVWTISWGITGHHVRQGMEWTQQKADREFVDELSGYVKQIKPMCTFQPDEHELAAMTSLAWNIGLDGFKKSTVLKCHNRGDKESAARAFMLWDKATINGKKVVLPGLVTRRAREAAMYLTPDSHAPIEPMPQAVASESKLAVSPIAQGGAATSIAGFSAIAASMSEDVGSIAKRIGDAAPTFGVSTAFAVGLFLLAVGGVVLYQRFVQRNGGWA